MHKKNLSLKKYRQFFVSLDEKKILSYKASELL